MHKRLICGIIATITLITCLFLGSCSNSGKTENLVDVSIPGVYFFDVGMGECIFINFGDGTNVMIDTGDVSKKTKTIIDALKKSNVSKINHLILTHPDADHVGGTVDFVDNFEIENAYIPHVRDLSLFPSFDKAKTSLEVKCVNTTTSKTGLSIKGEKYFLAFLSPESPFNHKSPYVDLNASEFPSSNQIKNVSPIIYVSLFGKRFLFTGDALSSQETAVMENYVNGYYDLIFGKDEVNLKSIDVLKVANHGGNTSSSEYFLSVVSPKCAVLCVGRNGNSYPSGDALKRIMNNSPNVNLLRTDVKGGVCMLFDGDFNMKTSTFK